MFCTRSGPAARTAAALALLSLVLVPGACRKPAGASAETLNPAAAKAVEAPSPAAAQAAPVLKPYVAANKLYVLFKPAAWNVTENAGPSSFRVLVQSPDNASVVDFIWARNTTANPGALAFLVALRKSLSQAHGDVRLSEVFASKDDTRATATVRYAGPGGPVAGKYYVESRSTGQSAQGYLAPEKELAARRPLLLNVMASFAFGRASGGSAAQAGSAGQVQAPPPYQIALASRRAPDGSLSIRVPSDWKFLAGGGRVLTASPDGGMGFIFTSLSGNPLLPQATVAQGIIGTRYLPPAQALAFVFNAFRNRDFRILTAKADQATMRECLVRLGGACDAQDFQVSYTSPEGTACVGGFKIINGAPSPMTGIWTCILAGIWGPEREFGRYLPTLEQIASSFAINNEYARRYIQAGLENLRRLQQKTQAAMQDLNNARAQNQRDWEARQERKEFMDAGWDDYRRGHSYWVSELEGGKVYATDSGGTQDTVTGQYYEGRPYNWVNFEGQNPRHPSETMREINSYELKKLEGGR